MSRPLGQTTAGGRGQHGRQLHEEQGYPSRLFSLFAAGAVCDAACLARNAADVVKDDFRPSVFDQCSPDHCCQRLPVVFVFTRRM